MHRIKAFFTNRLVLNLAVIGVLTLLIIWGLSMCLSRTTCHGCQITVPDFTGMSRLEAEEMCKKRELQFEVRKVGYSEEFPKNSIIDQLPKGESKVKKGRTIYFTINSAETPMVALDDIAGNPARQAEKILLNAGFEIEEEYEYEPDPGENWVLKVKLNGEEIKWGDEIPKGSRLTLVVGNGMDNGEPLRADNLIGQAYDEFLIQRFRLSRRVMGRIDSSEVNGPALGALVYKQNPRPGEIIKPSEPINIWLLDSFAFDMRLDTTYQDEP